MNKQCYKMRLEEETGCFCEVCFGFNDGLIVSILNSVSDSVHNLFAVVMNN